jgi:hypothetical protein
MASLRETLQQARVIETTPSGPVVEQTVADELRAGLCPTAQIKEGKPSQAAAGTVRVAVLEEPSGWKAAHPALDGDSPWMMVRTRPGAGVEILASAPHLLFTVYTAVAEDWVDLPVEQFSEGRISFPTFRRFRPSYDSFLTQHNRTVQRFDREEHIRNLARMGFSHAEVNGLAFALPFEQGPKGEVLHRFYTYCAALDQFVTSKLNTGFYDNDYLQANLNNLKKNAALATKYGLRPGITCFEPRSVPDAMLARYPMLRGARVDHPIRSWHPRYNLSIAHPVVRDHYAEMMENLMREVPQLDYIAIWSNDSGAGFEYTSSMYVGRNGGGYVIREWKGDREIAEAAAENMMRYQRLLRDAGRKTNPAFRSIMRLEAFTTEHEHVWNRLEDGIDVEASSVATVGWDVPYKHPRYAERKAIAGTALFNEFGPQEKKPLEELRAKGSEVDLYFWPGGVWNHEPLIGIPFPKLVLEKLKAMAEQGLSSLCFSGGTTPRSFAPFNINEELVRSFQRDRELDLETFLKEKAEAWIGQKLADDLVGVWGLSEEAYRGFPVPVQIYSGWGVWYRLLTRPIVPDIEKISERDRAYYEEFLLAPPHNRCRIDFRYDVGFDLIEPETAMKHLDLIDQNVLPKAEEAVAAARRLLEKAGDGKEKQVAQDLYDRIFAVKCWYRNQRNVTAWIAGVHTYLETRDEGMKKKCRQILHDMVLDEIQNARDLLSHWENARTQWMILSDVGETTFIYYTNFGEHLKRKIELMQGHENDEPHVDPDFQWRVPGINWEAER